MRAAWPSAIAGSHGEKRKRRPILRPTVFPASHRKRRLRVLPGEPLVEFDAKAGPVGDADLPVRKLFRRNDQILTPRRLTPSVLEGKEIGQSGAELHAGGRRNRPAGIVG